MSIEFADPIEVPDFVGPSTPRFDAETDIIENGKVVGTSRTTTFIDPDGNSLSQTFNDYRTGPDTSSRRVTLADGSAHELLIDHRGDVVATHEIFKDRGEASNFEGRIISRFGTFLYRHDANGNVEYVRPNKKEVPRERVYKPRQITLSSGDGDSDNNGTVNSTQAITDIANQNQID